MSKVEKIRCWIMRGGTSKAIFLMENDIPSDPEKRKEIILKIFGSPDKRQIDGLGGADPLTSKCAVIGASERDDADVDYTFYNIGIETGSMKPSICGNVSAAVGPFAIDEHLVRATEPLTKVRIYSTHTKKVISAEVPVFQAKAEVHGDYKIAGVPGSGAKIMLDWKNVVGIETGALLPTGNVKDRIYVHGVGELAVSIVDCGNPVVFIPADSLGLKGTELPEKVDSDNRLLEKLELIRGSAAELVGLVKNRIDSRKENPNHPLLAFVSPPTTYATYSGSEVKATETDLVSRMMFMQIMHKTYAGSGAICTGIASLIEGTVVNEVVRKGAIAEKKVRIGHPGGIMEVESEIETVGSSFLVKRAAIGRTARRIMDGYVYIRT
jgi:2-methylaconitate cis-trans-isomerase PrpF